MERFRVAFSDPLPKNEDVELGRWLVERFRVALSDPIPQHEDVKLGEELVKSFRDDLFEIRRDEPVPGNPVMRWLNHKRRANKSKGVENATKPRLKVNIAGLNRMRMRKLQIQLVQQVLHMRYEKTEPKGWEDLLEKYSRFIAATWQTTILTSLVAAVKDYDFVKSCVDRGILDDPFVVVTERVIDGAVLRSLLNNEISAEQRKADGLETITKETFAPPLEKESQPIGGTRLARTEKQKTEDFISRVVFSLVGGVFLVAPMWLMVLHNTKYTALISTSVFVIAAGVVAAWKLEQPIAVLSTTAAYAAVLVVFVGTNTASSPSPQNNTG